MLETRRKLRSGEAFPLPDEIGELNQYIILRFHSLHRASKLFRHLCTRVKFMNSIKLRDIQCHL